MNSYTDTRIIECARLHSEEALSGNHENFSLWTNNLTDIIHLDPGDQVSLHGAMVSERGAGQSQSIEIKGESLGFKKTFNFIETKSEGNACEDIPVGNTYLASNISSKEVDMRDDTAVFQISYYITGDGHNYIQLPRRFWWRNNFDPLSQNYTNQDIGIGSTSTEDSGRSLWDPFNASQGNNSHTYADGIQYFDDFQQNADNRYAYSSQINNGRRYTLMIRDKSYYSEASASGNLPGKYMRDPENAVYNRYTELKEIQVDKGFNSPDYIATDVSRKLQEVLKETTFSVRNAGDITYNASRPGFPIKQFKTYTTETYKPFDVAWNYSTTINTDFTHYIMNGSAPNNGSGYEWLSQYHITACLRPELYETGRLINLSGTEDRGILGAELKRKIFTDNVEDLDYMVTSILYEKQYIDKFRDFIRAQEKYPEIFDILQDSRTPYNDGDNITNCRFFHMNRYNNASSTLDPSDTSKAQLGWGGYIQPSWRSNTAPLQLGAVLVPFVYDDSQRDKYYDDPDENLNQLTYGCFAKETLVVGTNASGEDITQDFIKVKITEENGYFNPLFERYLREGARDSSPGQVEVGRKIGFDLHFNSMGNCWILPFSGHTLKPNSFNGAASLISSAQVFADQQMIDRGSNSGQYNVTFPHLSQLYMGADAPKLNWDGTHFSFSDLHTSLNRGNDARSNVPWNIGRSGIDASDKAGSVVYKVNPTEQFQDWTPVRMPYQGHRNLYKNASHIEANSYEVNAFNTNLTPWQIYDAPCGIFIEDFNLTEDEWEGSFWSRLGFSYRQFHNSSNTRLERVEKGNANFLSVITTNSEVDEGDTKIQIQNFFGAPYYNTMIPRPGTLKTIDKDSSPETSTNSVAYLPEIVQETESIKIIADNLPTRMIRGYYTVRTNIMNDNPFIGGKKNNTIMPIIAVIDKVNGDGDFYFQQDSSLVFTITKPLRLASITCSINDPDGSLANTNEQNTILFKVVKQKQVTFNVLQELLQQQQGNQPKM